MFSNLSPHQIGLVAAIASPALWGIAPIFFHFLTAFALDEILVHRAIWAAVFMLGLFIILGDGKTLFTTIQTKKQLAGLFVGACLVTINWTAFLYAVGTAQITESAFGYFIYPLMAIALGMIVFREKLDRRGWLALIVATAGVLVKATQLDGIPYIALLIGASFAVYAVVRKQINIDAFAGMVIELLMIAPIMLAYLVYLTFVIKPEGASLFLDGSSYGVMMALASGIVTSVPLVLFHVGNRVPAPEHNRVFILYKPQPAIAGWGSVVSRGVRLAGYAGFWPDLDSPAISICTATKTLIHMPVI